MKNPLVVGYRGEIGRYILNGLIDYIPSATNILCFDVNDSAEDQAEKIRKADVIFLCVPIHLTVDFIVLWNYQLKGKVIVEQTSLKGVLYSDPRFKNIMPGIDLLSMHVLFRPSATPNKEDQNIAIICSNGKEATNWVSLGIRHFLINGLGIGFSTFSSWKKHDSEMAVQQALVHRVLLTLSGLISKDKKANTYIGKQVNKLSDRIKKGDYGLYKLIQENPQLFRKLREFGTKMEIFNFDDYISKRYNH